MIVVRASPPTTSSRLVALRDSSSDTDSRRRRARCDCSSNTAYFDNAFVAARCATGILHLDEEECGAR